MPTQVKLPKRQYRSVIRLIKQLSMERVKALHVAVYNTLKRLQIKRDPSKAVEGIPKGSNQVNIGSIVVWLGKIGPGDEEAINQVVTLEATAALRAKG